MNRSFNTDKAVAMTSRQDECNIVSTMSFWSDIHFFLLSYVRHSKMCPDILIENCARYYHNVTNRGAKKESFDACMKSFIRCRLLKVMSQVDLDELGVLLTLGDVYTSIGPGGDMYPRIGAVEYTWLGADVAQIDWATNLKMLPDEFSMYGLASDTLKSNLPERRRSRGRASTVVDVLASKKSILLSEINMISDNYEHSGVTVLEKKTLEPSQLWRDHWWRSPQPMWRAEIVLDGTVDVTFII